ncbi:MarR family winged helix-turn-helix transcriptional regulator [Sporosarcina koreensis]|uniref:MarR family winged helix-turn-helix transcriptional regulator n=1 Tax=Sporosarcina koreensis TaxID=334735 RepID=UPI00058B1D0A|nr:MarR family transcriptional regulator [Sporosarcina koreensis]
MDEFFTLDKQLCFAVQETAGEFSRLYAGALKQFGLTYPQYVVLLALWERDGQSMKELGERVSLGTGTLTPMVSRMQDKGWLRKQRSSEDERKVFVQLNQKAIDEKPAIMQRVSEVIELCKISVHEYEELMTRLNDLHAKLKKRSEAAG